MPLIWDCRRQEQHLTRASNRPVSCPIAPPCCGVVATRGSERMTAWGLQVLLKVRALLLTLRPLPNARHGAAADVLLLIAHTKTFAKPTRYATVRGDPVQVSALCP